MQRQQLRRQLDLNPRTRTIRNGHSSHLQPKSCPMPPIPHSHAHVHILIYALQIHRYTLLHIRTYIYKWQVKWQAEHEGNLLRHKKWQPNRNVHRSNGSGRAFAPLSFLAPHGAVDKIKIVRQECRIKDMPHSPPLSGSYLAGIKYKLLCCAIINFSLRKNVKFIHTMRGKGHGARRRGWDGGVAATLSGAKNPL